jgi:hypothetical protein
MFHTMQQKKAMQLECCSMQKEISSDTDPTNKVLLHFDLCLLAALLQQDGAISLSITKRRAQQLVSSKLQEKQL